MRPQTATTTEEQANAQTGNSTPPSGRTMPTIQSAASKSGKSLGGVIKHGPKLPAGGVVISVRHLPNPYGKLHEFKFTHNISDADWPKRVRDQIKLFLRTLAPGKLDRVIKKGQTAIQSGKPIAVVCSHGRDRSPAVAEMIGELFHPSQIKYEHRELSTSKTAGASGDDDCA